MIYQRRVMCRCYFEHLAQCNKPGNGTGTAGYPPAPPKPGSVPPHPAPVPLTHNQTLSGTPIVGIAQEIGVSQSVQLFIALPLTLMIIGDSLRASNESCLSIQCTASKGTQDRDPLGLPSADDTVAQPVLDREQVPNGVDVVRREYLVSRAFQQRLRRDP